MRKMIFNIDPEQIIIPIPLNFSKERLLMQVKSFFNIFGKIQNFESLNSSILSEIDVKAETTYLKRKIKLNFIAKNENENLILQFHTNLNITKIMLHSYPRDIPVNQDDCAIYLKFWDLLLQDYGYKGREGIGRPIIWDINSPIPPNESIQFHNTNNEENIRESYTKSLEIALRIKDLNKKKDQLLIVENTIKNNPKVFINAEFKQVQQNYQDIEKEISDLKTRANLLTRNALKWFIEQNFHQIIDELEPFSEELNEKGILEPLIRIEQILNKARYNLEIMDKITKFEEMYNFGDLKNAHIGLVKYLKGTNEQKDLVHPEVRNKLISLTDQVVNEVENRIHQIEQDIIIFQRYILNNQKEKAIQLMNQDYSYAQMMNYGDILQTIDFLMQNIPLNEQVQNAFNKIMEIYDQGDYREALGRLVKIEQQFELHGNRIYGIIRENISNTKRQIGMDITQAREDFKAYVESFSDDIAKNDQEEMLDELHDRLSEAKRYGFEAEFPELNNRIHQIDFQIKILHLFKIIKKFNLNDGAKVLGVDVPQFIEKINASSELRTKTLISNGEIEYLEF